MKELRFFRDSWAYLRLIKEEHRGWGNRFPLRINDVPTPPPPPPEIINNPGGQKFYLLLGWHIYDKDLVGPPLKSF